MAITPPVVIS